MSDDLYGYVDGKGKRVKAGDRVVVAGYDPATEIREECFGTVSEIVDPDGDVNDEGRAVGINPRVKVDFEDGSEDSFVGHWTCSGPGDEGAPFRFDDIEVVEDSVMPDGTVVDALGNFVGIDQPRAARTEKVGDGAA